MGWGAGPELQGQPWGQELRGKECVEEERNPLRPPSHHHLPWLKPHCPPAHQPPEKALGRCSHGGPQGDWVGHVHWRKRLMGMSGSHPQLCLAPLQNHSHSWGHGP